MKVMFHNIAFEVADDPACLESFIDEAELRERYWDVRPGDVVLDAGSHWGSYSLCALAAGAAKVIAVDLGLETLLNLLLSQCVFFRAGLGDVRGKSWTSPWDGKVWPVPSETVDWLLRDEPRLDWVKIDVEGEEAAVLRGGRETLRRLRPKMIIEDHQRIELLHMAPDYRKKVEQELLLLGYSWHHVPYFVNGEDAGRDFWLAWPMEKPELAFELSFEDAEAAACLARARELGGVVTNKVHVVRLGKP